jgi:hypothetical protein
MPEPAAVEQDLWRDLQPLLDRELSRLPDKYRAPIVLCDLEGKTRNAAARQLAVPAGPGAGRLARARALLAKRLARHGLPASGGSLAAVLSQNAASAAVPTAVLASTIKAAGLWAAGPAAAAGLISAPVAALTEGVLKTMLLAKLKIPTAVLVTVLFCGGVGVRMHTMTTAGPTEPAPAGANTSPEAPPGGAKAKNDDLHRRLHNFLMAHVRHLHNLVKTYWPG